jgi:molecular chaperone GrpE
MSDSSTTEEQDSAASAPSPVAEESPPTDAETSAPSPPAAEAATAEPEAAPPTTSTQEEEWDQEELELSEMEARLLEDMDRLQSERNDYLDQLLRTRADFDNYRKRILKQQSEIEQRAAESLVEKLLDALDTFDMAVAHGQGFEQVRDKLVMILAKEGLERIDPVGEQFDPTEADAVAHEDGDGGPVVSEVLRAGYRWKGRVLRPAMVKVKG